MARRRWPQPKEPGTGRRVLCGTRSLAQILPRGSAEHTLLVLRRPRPPTPIEPELVGSPPRNRPPTNIFEVKLHTPAADVLFPSTSAAAMSMWPTPRAYVPATPSAESCAVVLPRPPLEDAATLRIAVTHAMFP